MTTRPGAVLVIAWSTLVVAWRADAVDVTGKWRFTGAGLPATIVQMTQSGSTLSFTYGESFSGSLSAAGSFTSYSVTASAPIMAAMTGRITPSGNLLDGRLVVAPFLPGELPSVGGVVGRRCTCDDGNTANGDGCDTTCQVEPCWTCTGDPSVCTPVSDGGACEDGSVCTTGETCTSGACGGGSPVSPCIDMSGPWNRHIEVPDLGVTNDVVTDAAQYGTDVILGGYVGSIDPATGAFNLRVTNLNLFCFIGFDPLNGSVAPNGLTYSASGSVDIPLPGAPDHCGSYPLTETGTRCGNGTIDPGEQCDDGNAVSGDCCSSTCQFEPLNAPCNDNNPCTVGDRCTGTGVCGSTSCNVGASCGQLCGATLKCKVQGFTCRCG